MRQPLFAHKLPFNLPSSSALLLPSAITSTSTMTNASLTLLSFLDLPFDVLVEILSLLHSPRDLLCLCRADESLRALLTQHCFDFVWRHVRESYIIRSTRSVNKNKNGLLWREIHTALVPMPEKPVGVQELMFAELAFKRTLGEVCLLKCNVPH